MPAALAVALPCLPSPSTRNVLNCSRLVTSTMAGIACFVCVNVLYMHKSCIQALRSLPYIAGASNINKIQELFALLSFLDETRPVVIDSSRLAFSYCNCAPISLAGPTSSTRPSTALAIFFLLPDRQLRPILSDLLFVVPVLIFVHSLRVTRGRSRVVVHTASQGVPFPVKLLAASPRPEVTHVRNTPKRGEKKTTKQRKRLFSLGLICNAPCHAPIFFGCKHKS